MRSNLAYVVVSFLLAVFVLTACDPAPARVLNQDEKRADMLWLFSMLDQNYAPRELKESNFGFDYAALKQQYLQEAVGTSTNAEFYAVIHRFVAEFRDPHTSSMLMASSLPDRSKIAFLGFNGVRSGDSLIVTELLPTTAASASFPVHVGDEIIKLDGKPLRDVVLNEMARYRNLGYDESNLTYHMNGIFTRTDLVTPLPTQANAVLTISRSGTEREITLPWVVKDLTTFLNEQAAAAPVGAKIAGIDAKEFLQAGKDLLASDDPVSALGLPVAGLGNHKLWNSFKFIDSMPTLTSRTLVERVRSHLRGTHASTSFADARATLSTLRNVPPDALFLPEATTYPTYIAQFASNGDARPFYAYMLLNDFTPADEDGALAEISQVLARLKQLHVHHLIIDTIDNGGGSLSFGLKAAQLLSKAPLKQPKIQLKTSETWIDEYQTRALSAPSDAERELARRVAAQLVADRDAGKVTSDPMDIDVLMPFQFLEGNSELGDMKIALLVNEMCVSMCDIFAGALKDNDLATTIGKRTMGGGGNIVQHFEAPNSHLLVSTTESLILRNNGTPIENNGVAADIEMEVNQDAFARYDNVIQRAIDLLNPCQSDCSKDDGQAKSSGGGCDASRSSGPSFAGTMAILFAGVFAARRRRRATSRVIG